MNRREEAHIIKAAINSQLAIYSMLSVVDVGDPLLRSNMRSIIEKLSDRLASIKDGTKE